MKWAASVCLQRPRVLCRNHRSTLKTTVLMAAPHLHNTCLICARKGVCACASMHRASPVGVAFWHVSHQTVLRGLFNVHFLILFIYLFVLNPATSVCSFFAEPNT